MIMLFWTCASCIRQESTCFLDSLITILSPDSQLLIFLLLLRLGFLTLWCSLWSCTHRFVSLILFTASLLNLLWSEDPGVALSPSIFLFLFFSLWTLVLSKPVFHLLKEPPSSSSWRILSHRQDSFVMIMKSKLFSSHTNTSLCLLFSNDSRARKEHHVCCIRRRNKKEEERGIRREQHTNPKFQTKLHANLLSVCVSSCQLLLLEFCGYKETWLSWREPKSPLLSIPDSLLASSLERRDDDHLDVGEETFAKEKSFSSPPSSSRSLETQWTSYRWRRGCTELRTALCVALRGIKAWWWSCRWSISFLQETALVSWDVLLLEIHDCVSSFFRYLRLCIYDALLLREDPSQRWHPPDKTVRDL